MSHQTILPSRSVCSDSSLNGTLLIQIVDADYDGIVPKGSAGLDLVNPSMDQAGGSQIRMLYHRGEEAKMRAFTWGRGAALVIASSIAAHAAMAQTGPAIESKSTQRGSALERNVEGRINNWTVGLAGGLPEGTILGTDRAES